MRRIEKRWWDERFEDYRDFCERGRIRDMCKCLWKIGTKRGKAPESIWITVNVFKKPFELVSRVKYEEDLSVIVRVNPTYSVNFIRMPPQLTNIWTRLLVNSSDDLIIH